MRLIDLPTNDPVIELVLEYREYPDAALCRASWIARQLLRTEYHDGDVTVILEVHPISPANTPPVGRMVAYEEPGTGEAPLIHQRVEAYGIMLSERGLLGTVMSRLTGVPGVWNLPGGGLDAGGEPTAGLLCKVHKETDRQVVPGQLLTLQSDRWIGHASNGGLEGCRALCIIYSMTCGKPSHLRIHDLEGLAARADWIPVKFWYRVPWTRAVRQMLSQHLPSRWSLGPGITHLPGQSLR